MLSHWLANGLVVTSNNGASLSDSHVIPFAVIYISCACRAEQMMCELFGEQYRDYVVRTADWFSF